jgi:hypothetical protein
MMDTAAKALQWLILFFIDVGERIRKLGVEKSEPGSPL